jgi:hypothetical protein
MENKISVGWRLPPVKGLVLSAVFGALVLGACGPSVKPPTSEISSAELAVLEAENSKAPQYAALDLRVAKEKLTGAKRAMAGKDYETARRLAEEALVNAQLAQNKADSETARRTAAEMRKSIEVLREELERAHPGNQ